MLLSAEDRGEETSSGPTLRRVLNSASFLQRRVAGAGGACGETNVSAMVEPYGLPPRVGFKAGHAALDANA